MSTLISLKEFLAKGMCKSYGGVQFILNKDWNERADAYINKFKRHMESKRAKLTDEFTDSGAVSFGYTQALGEMLRFLRDETK